MKNRFVFQIINDFSIIKPESWYCDKRWHKFHSTYFEKGANFFPSRPNLIFQQGSAFELTVIDFVLVSTVIGQLLGVLWYRSTVALDLIASPISRCLAAISSVFKTSSLRSLRPLFFAVSWLLE